MTLTDWIGCIGVSVVLVAFLLNIFKKITHDSLFYILFNLVGAAVSCLAAVMLKYWPFIILEGVWTIASGVALIQRLKKKQQML